MFKLLYQPKHPLVIKKKKKKGIINQKHF